jgi:hypothetical protein
MFSTWSNIMESQKNILLYAIHLSISSRLWIPLTDQMIEMRHFSMSIFIWFLLDLISRWDPDCCIQIFEITPRLVVCYHMIKLVLSLARQNFEQFGTKCNPFGFLIVVKSMRTQPKLNFFDSKTLCTLCKHGAFVSLKLVHSLLHEWKDISEA